MKEQILEFIKENLLEEDIEVDFETPLFSNKLLDSLNMTELIAFIEERFNIKVELSEIVYDNFDTVANIADFIHRKQKN